MKPAPFEYHRAYYVAEVIELLAELGDDAKIIAGGQSLAPMMNFRLARPSALVDVNPVAGLDYIRREGDLLRIGALTRHRDVEISQDPGVHNGFGVLPRAARWIGHYPIRCRGTVGGSIAHSDSTAEWCLLALLYDASVVVQGPRGQRTIPATEWFTGFLTTSGEYDEMVVETQFARPRAYGALTEYARRRGDFAISSVGVAFDKTDDRITDVSVVLGGVAGAPVRATEAEAMIEGGPATPETWVEASRSAAASVDPPSDLNGDAHYRRQLVETLMQRAFVEALDEGDRR